MGPPNSVSLRNSVYINCNLFHLLSGPGRFVWVYVWEKMFTCLHICAFLPVYVFLCTHMWPVCVCMHATFVCAREGEREDSEQSWICCLFNALQGQEMFTVVYLCYSPASQLWLAPFTRPQLQLQLNKTSNRDIRPLYLTFSPCSLKMISHTAIGDKKKRCWKMFSLTPNSSSLVLNFLLFNNIFMSLSSIHSTNIHLPTHHGLILVRQPPSGHFSPFSASVSVSVEKLCLLCHGGLLQSELKVVVSGLGRDHIRLKNIKLFAFFSTLTMKKW